MQFSPRLMNGVMSISSALSDACVMENDRPTSSPLTTSSSTSLPSTRTQAWSGRCGRCTDCRRYSDLPPPCMSVGSVIGWAVREVKCRPAGSGAVTRYA